MSFKDTFTIRCTACSTKNRIPAEKTDEKAKCGKCGVYLDMDTVFSGKSVMVSDADFDQKVLKSPLPVLLYCWATWCATCKTTTPVIEEFARDAKGRIRVAKLNVDGNPMTSSKYNILSLPYLLVFDNGQLMEGFPGGMPKHELMMKMAHFI
jgi:thioredoxin 2